jgi:hypothetical protein
MLHVGTLLPSQPLAAYKDPETINQVLSFMSHFLRNILISHSNLRWAMENYISPWEFLNNICILS